MTQSLHALFASWNAPASVAGPVLDAYRAIFAYGGDAELAATEAVCELPWPTETQESALTLLAQQAASVRDDDYKLLAQQLILTCPPVIPAQLITGLKRAMVSVLDGIEPDTGHLQLIARFSAADAAEIVLARPNAISGLVQAIAGLGPSVEVLSEALSHTIEMGGEQLPSLISRTLMTNYRSEYICAAILFVERQLNGDTDISADGWRFLLAPLDVPEIEPIFARLGDALTNSQGEVDRAVELLAGLSLCDQHRGRTVEVAARALNHWIVERADGNAASKVAAAVAVDKEAAAQLRASIKAPRSKEPRAAWQAAVNELK